MYSIMILSEQKIDIWDQRSGFRGENNYKTLGITSVQGAKVLANQSQVFGVSTYVICNIRFNDTNTSHQKLNMLEARFFEVHQVH